LIIAFSLLAAFTLLSGLGVVLSRNVVHSALFMAASFLGIAGFFVLLNAPALAAFQVLIYVGAVTVLVLFGIMFTQRPSVRSFGTILQAQHIPGLIAALGLGVFIAYVLTIQDWGEVAPGHGPRSVEDFGAILLGAGEYPDVFALLFQLGAIILLVATVAAIVISRRRREEDEI
jgi:NADH:ubiquinone oxidoreductase subunit 6 (subunit J)